MDAPARVAAILAHQGGWDEILLVAGPIAVVAGLLALAKRRIERTGPTVDEHHDHGPDGHSDGRHADGQDVTRR